MVVSDIEEAHDLLSRVHARAPSFCFVRRHVVEAIRLLLAHFVPQWKLQKEHEADYIKAMTRRFMNLSRVIAQGQQKARQPAWVHNLPWNRKSEGSTSKKAGAGDVTPHPKAPAPDDGSQGSSCEGEEEEQKAEDNQEGEGEERRKAWEEDEAASASDAQGKRKQDLVDDTEASPSPRRRKKIRATATEYFYGYSKELGNAWRVRSDDPASTKELAAEVMIPEGALPYDPVHARWPDGDTAVIGSCTVAQRRAHEQERPEARKPLPQTWSARHPSTGNKLVVKPRSGGHGERLMALWEQHKPVCSVPYKWFGDEDDEEAAASAGKVMQAVGQRYLADELECSTLKAGRDEELRKMGITPKKGRQSQATAPRKNCLVKRPAAAEQEKISFIEPASEPGPPGGDTDQGDQGEEEEEEKQEEEGEEEEPLQEGANDEAEDAAKQKGADHEKGANREKGAYREMLESILDAVPDPPQDSWDDEIRGAAPRCMLLACTWGFS